MQYSADKIGQILGCEKVNIIDFTLKNIGFDSRNINSPSETLFFALSGRVDGHTYLQQAYERGVRNFVVSKPIFFPDSNIFLVKNTLEALKKLARTHRQNFDLKTIGITGSNGKTIVKDWLSQLLDDEYFIIKSPRSYNSQLGVAISVLEIEKNHNLGIFEAGISQKKEMKSLEEMIKPQIGILTNIGDAHDEGFMDKNEKLEEKIQLFASSEVVLCHASFAPFILEKFPNKPLFTWKKEQDDTPYSADLVVKNINSNEYNNTIINAFYKEKNISIVIPFSDYASVENAITCWMTMIYMSYPQHVIVDKMALLQPIALRMEIKAGINNCTIINDAYSLDFTSLSYSLDFLNHQAKGKKTLILSDVQQSGKSDDELYAQIADLLEKKQIHRLILIGKKSPKHLKTDIPTSFFDDTKDFLAKIKLSDFEQETILLKGARTYEFEQIAEFLSQKAHRTVLEINLEALRYNLAYFGRFLKPEVKTLVMVKASAYGSGSSEVAKLLEYQRVDYLGVAYTDEGVALRKEGSKLPILVLNPEENSFPLLLRYDLEPEIYCFSQLERFLRFVNSTQQSVGVHLKLDTGMHRLGFEPKEIDGLCEILKNHKNLKIKSIFSHLAGSDADEHDDFTHHQAKIFTEMYEKIAQNINYRPIRHICNTGGISRFPQYHFDMVRLGIGIYGIGVNEATQSQLKVVSTLKATISQIKNIPQGESIGYSRKGLAERDLRIATISIGYADGFLRSAGNGHFSVVLHQKDAPVIGNVCMDMTMIDVTDIPNAKEGDEVCIFGENPSVEKLAKATQTIPYEVFTNVSDRVKRVYIREL
jgi:Alr-MurF fusion protein